MTQDEARRLGPGDEVFWNDPDDGACSRAVVIQTIEHREDVVLIREPSGAVIEAFVWELE